MKMEGNKIATASTALQSLADTTNATSTTKKEIILQLKKDIVAARTKGKTWTEIIKTINDAGISVTYAYVRSIIRSKTNANRKKVNATKNKENNNKIVTTTATSAGRNVIRPDSEDL